MQRPLDPAKPKGRKIAIGFNNNTADVIGNRSVNGVGSPGGLLAQPTNIGHFTRTTPTAVPELGVKLGYRIRPNMQAYVGYTFLYWYHVARSGDQIDPNVDSSFLANGAAAGTPTRPAFTMQQRDIWVQGVSLGFEWRY